MNKKEVKQLALKHYNDADYSNHFSDVTNASYDHISIDTDWLYQALYDAYMNGFNDGFHTAKETPKDEFGNFIND